MEAWCGGCGEGGGAGGVGAVGGEGDYAEGLYGILLVIGGNDLRGR